MGDGDARRRAKLKFDVNKSASDIKIGQRKDSILIIKPKKSESVKVSPR